MRVLWVIVFILGGSSFFNSLRARSYSNLCEQIYYEINREETHRHFKTKYTGGDYTRCVQDLGESSLLREAQKYKEDVSERLDLIERRIEERIEVAKGKKSGKVTKVFSEDSLRNHRRNYSKSPLASWVALYKRGKKEDEFKTDPDRVCRKLGFKRSLSHKESRKYDNSLREDRKKMPKRILEYRTLSRLFLPDGEKVVFHDLEDKDLGYGVIFRYYTELECEKTVQEGDEIEDFEIDLKAIRAAVNREVKRPPLSDEVARILSLDDDAKVVEGKSHEERTDVDNRPRRRQSRKERGLWESKDYGDSEFIFEPEEEEPHEGGGSRSR